MFETVVVSLPYILYNRCHHSEGNKCLNCAPLEVSGSPHRSHACHVTGGHYGYMCVLLQPFDTAYLESLDPPIKFLSFHSYIRKLRSGIDK